MKEYNGELLINPLISYPEMKTKYPIKILDLKHQTRHITPRKTQQFQEYGIDPDIARLFVISIKQREIELLSAGNKLIEEKVI